MAAAIEMRFPQLDFAILIVTLDGDRHNDFSGPLDSRIVVEVLPQLEGRWSAADVDCDRLLERIAYVGEGETVPLETLYWF